MCTLCNHRYACFLHFVLPATVVCMTIPGPPLHFFPCIEASTYRAHFTSDIHEASLMNLASTADMQHVTYEQLFQQDILCIKSAHLRMHCRWQMAPGPGEQHA